MAPVLTNITARFADRVAPKVANIWRPNSRTKPSEFVGDFDAVYVQPLPVQQRILDAFAQLGFVFKGVDLEYGQIHGVRQTLPFYQEIEYFPAPQYAQCVSEVELTFVTSPHAVEVVLEFDKRGGVFSGGRDAHGRYTIAHADADTTDWAQVVDGWVRPVEH